jgi:Carboxypeptidase regulatory-like domain
MRYLHLHRSAIAPVKIFALILAFLLISTFPGSLKAQSLISGDITGAVTDPSGATVPGAKVTITSKATGAVQTTTTNSSGSYRIPLLQPGAYTLAVEATGFEQASLSVSISAGTTLPADVRLTVGSASQTVEVTAAAPILHTEAADLSTTFSMQQVQSLPNPGNDLTFVAQTAPGSVMNTGSGYGNFSSFGLPATSNTFTINGGYLNDPFLNVNNSGATNLLLGNNDVSDVTVISNAYNASFGGLGGAQINEISRSGSNKFHGNAAYWWNGSSMNANNFFNNQSGTKKPFDNVNQWATAIGGPIYRDKSFFFFNYEGLRVVLPTRSTVYAPDASYETKTLANLVAGGHGDEVAGYTNIFNLYNNAPGRANAVVSTPDDEAGGYGTVRFNGNAGNFTHEWLMTGRIDQSFRDKDHLFGHFEVDKGLQATYTNVLDPIFNADSPQPQYSGQLNETHTFSPTLTNQFLFAAIYYRAIFTNTNLAGATNLVPFSLIFADGDLGNNGTAAWPGGLDIIWPQGRNVTGYQFTDDVNWNHGNHNIQLGWTIRRNDVTDYSPSEYTASPEAVGFNSSFQTGQIDEWFQQFPQRATQPVALYAMGWYIQDQWKVKPNLTVTYGMRFEHDSNPVCQTNCFARLPSDFNTVSTSPNTPYQSLIKYGQHQAFNSLQMIGYEPRIGFAYTPGISGHTTVRGGFGMFADAFPGQIADSFLNNAPTNVPFTILSQNFGNGNAPAAGYQLIPSAAGSAGKVAAASNAAFSAGFLHGATLNSLSQVPGFSPPNITNAVQHIKYPTYEEWSLTVEQQLTKTAALSVGYVGNRTYHQPIQANSVNAFGFGGLPSSWPNPNFASATQVYSAGVSNYNGLVTSIVNRARWLTLQFNWVYSHALDEISNGGFDPFNGANGLFQYPTNPYNFSQNYGNSDYDTRQYVSASYVIPLPYWGGPRVLTDGWEFSGTAFHNDGFPFTVTAGSVQSSIPFYSGTPLFARQVAPIKNNHCGGASHSVNGTNPCSFVTSFALPTALGQGRRNSVYASSYTDTDLAVSKSFAIPHWESAHLKVGIQAFNLFNHPNFAQPNANIQAGPTTGSLPFGTISSTVNTPTSILGAFLGGDASPRLLQLNAKFNF